jgi:hypothetical protein
MTKRVCVFCGSADGTRPAYRAAAVELGRALAERGWVLVYGGGKVGLMGAVADAALKAGGQVIGVIPQALVEKEIGHGAVTELIITQTMHERKAIMADRSDGVVTLPGGFGTLDEVAEIITWAQLGYHRKPVILANIDGFFDPLIGLMDHMARQGFIKPAHIGIAVVRSDIPSVMHTLETYQPPLIDKWIDKQDL